MCTSANTTWEPTCDSTHLVVKDGEAQASVALGELDHLALGAPHGQASEGLKAAALHAVEGVVISGRCR